MENVNYPSYTYPDSGNSSPRSREIDYENSTQLWEDPSPSLQHSNPNNKVKLMVSYNGKIQPRTHDNMMLSYVGGETKIMSIDRNVKFASLFSKVSCILSSDNSSSNNNSNQVASGFILKYQLPGEDLDALISVTNDDDLENMMHEYDRLCRGSPKPARLRVFLFPVLKSSSFGSTSSDKIDRESDRFVVEELSSGSVPLPPSQSQVNSNVDYLFGLEKSPVQAPIPVQIPVQRHEPDPQIDARIQELNRLHISVQEMNRQKTDDGSLFAGAPVNIPVGYWQQHQPPQQQQQQPVNIEQQQLLPQQPSQQQVLPQFQQVHHFQQQPHQIQQHPQQVYMVHAPPQENVHHAPIMRPVPTNQQQPAQQGYYREQVYRDQPVYSVGPVKYSEGAGVPVRPVASMESSVGYQQQVGYDSGIGRHVYYAAQPGSGGLVTAPFHGVSGEMRTIGSGATVPTDAKVVAK